MKKAILGVKILKNTLERTIDAREKIWYHYSMSRNDIVREIWELLPEWRVKDEDNPKNFDFHQGCKKWINNRVVYNLEDLEEDYLREYSDEELIKILEGLKKNG